MSDNARFGFVNFAETWNGRLAMMGFVIGLGTEPVSYTHLRAHETGA